LRACWNRCFGACGGLDDFIDRGIVAALIREVSGGRRCRVAACAGAAAGSAAAAGAGAAAAAFCASI